MLKLGTTCIYPDALKQRQTVQIVDISPSRTTPGQTLIIARSYPNPDNFLAVPCGRGFMFQETVWLWDAAELIATDDPQLDAKIEAVYARREAEQAAADEKWNNSRRGRRHLRRQEVCHA